MFKKIFCFICVLAFSASFASSVSATNEASFSLEDIATNKNRLFDTNLCVSCEVAAFVAEISYNPDELRFDSAKAFNETALISVNSEVSGKVKIAYLCEDGASGELIMLSFKSFTFDTEISLEVSQVIDKNGSDIVAASVKGAFVEISGTSQSSKPKTDKSSGKSPKATLSHIETTTLSSAVANEINLESNKNDSRLKTMAIVLSAVAVLGMGAVGFYLGRKSSTKKQIRSLLNEKDS